MIAKKSTLLIAGALIFVLGLGLVFGERYFDDSNLESEIEDSKIPDEVHLHAAFHIYQNDELLDLSGFEYMHFQPCDTDQDVPHNEDEITERAHLHDYVGDVVHVHRAETVWGDLINSLELMLAQPIRGYVNGESVDDILTTSINDYDRVLILSGENSEIEEKLNQLPDQDHILSVESLSESCGS